MRASSSPGGLIVASKSAVSGSPLARRQQSPTKLLRRSGEKLVALTMRSAFAVLLCAMVSACAKQEIVVYRSEFQAASNTCKKAPYLKMVLKVDVERQQVLREFYSIKLDELHDSHFLESCKVHDRLSFVCGGDIVPTREGQFVREYIAASESQVIWREAHFLGEAEREIRCLSTEKSGRRWGR